MERRNFIKTTGMAAIAATFAPSALSCQSSSKSIPFAGHVFDELPYGYDALESYIDSQTMELHYSKHHQGYYNKFMAAIKGTDLEKTEMADIFKNIGKYDDNVRNNGGGYYNHSLFWNNMSPKGGDPSHELLKALDTQFGSLDSLKEAFNNEAKTQFGSGWAWLVLNENNKLEVGNTPNQDNPWMPDVDIKGIPLLALDVWEHAYYLKYQNKRGDYVDAFWNVINWNEVNERFNMALKRK